MALTPNSLVLADGTVLENSSCGFAEKDLWCWIHDVAMAECFAIFNDPEKTKEIAAVYNTQTVIYKGFTELLAIKKSSDVLGVDTIDVRLTWPDGGEHSIEEINNKELNNIGGI